jgi:lysophospholipase L1-like esterase
MHEPEQQVIEGRRNFVKFGAGAISTLLLDSCGGNATSSTVISPAVTPAPPGNTAMAALRAYLFSHATLDFSLPQKSIDVPTVAWAGALSAQTPASSIPSGTIVPITSPLIGRDLPTLVSGPLPGYPTINGLPCMGILRAYTCKGNEKVVDSIQWFRIRTDATILELAGVVPDGNHSVQTLFIDGCRVQPNVLSSCRSGSRGGWNFGSIRIAFNTKRMRDIWIQTYMAAAYFCIENNASVESVSDSKNPQITVVGDSYLQQRSSSFGNDGALALEISVRLGLFRVSTDAIGGTGYWNSGGDVGNLNDRLPGHSTDNSDIYLVMAGLNDYADVTSSGLVWPTSSQFQHAVAGYLQGLRSAQPNALIAVTAPFCPIPPMSDASYIANSATNSSWLGDALYKASVIKTSIQKIPGPWVYIDVLMGTGWLNSSGATGDVTNLQWFTGGTPGAGTTATYKPGNTAGGGGGGFGGIDSVPVISGGSYSQAPEVIAVGGTGSGLLLSSSIDINGALTSINVVVPGAGYTAAGLPEIRIDQTFEQRPAVLGTPSLLIGTNPDGQYPLLSSAPPGVSAAQLNNIYTYLGTDQVHPSPPGIEYLAGRLSRNLYEAVAAL